MDRQPPSQLKTYDVECALELSLSKSLRASVGYTAAMDTEQCVMLKEEIGQQGGEMCK